MMKIRCTALQFTILLILAFSGFGGHLEDARRLMGEKKFAEAEALLAPLADSGKPSAEVLLAAVKSSMALGHFLSAELRAGKLLALDPRQPEALFLGAEASWYGGNTDSACARYRLFIRSQSKRSPELDRAFARLLTTLPSPDEFEAYLKLYGKGSPAWYFAERQMDIALDSLDGNQLLRLAAASLPAFGSPGQLRAVQERLRRAVEAQYIEPAAALDVIFRVKNPDVEHAHWIRRRISDNTEKVRWLFRMQDSYGAAFENRDMFQDFYNMHAIEDRTLRTELGRQYLGLEKIYSADPEMHRLFVHLIADRPQVFKEGKLVDSQQMAQRFTKLAAVFKDNPGVLRETTQRLFDHYLEDEQRIAVIRANPKAFHARYIRWFAEKTGDMPLERLIEGASLHFSDQMNLYREFLPLYNKAEDGAGLLKAATEYVMAQPGTFDDNHLRNHFFHSNALDMDRKFGLLDQLWRGAGANPRLVSLVTELEKRDEWKNYPKFPAFVEAVRKGESKGNHPLMHAHAQLNNMRENRQQPDTAIYTVTEAAVKSWNGTLDTLDDRDSVLARSLVDRHFHHVHDNGDEFAKAALLWAPKLGRTENWNWPIRRLREYGKRDVLREIFKVYEALVKAGWDGTADAWREFFSLSLPNNSEQSLLRAYYGRVDVRTGWNHIHQNREALTEQTMVHEMEALLKAHPPKPGDDFIVHTHGEMLNRLRRDSKLADPDAYINAFWMAVCDESQVNRQYAWHLGELMANSGMSGKILTSIQPHLQDLPPEEKLKLLQYVLFSSPGEVDDAAAAAGHKRDVLFNHIQPLIKSLSPLQSMDVRLDGRVFFHLERAAKGPDAMKTDALALLDTLGTWVVFGMPVSGGRDEKWGGLGNSLNRALAEGNLPLAAMIARMVVTSASENWGHWRHAVEPMLGQLEAAKVNHVLAGSLRILLSDRETPADLRQRAAGMLGRAGQDVGLYPVPPSDPTYPLYVAANAVRGNNEALAWELTEPNLQLVAREWEKLDNNYVSWTAEKLRQRMDFDLSMNMIRLLLSKEQELDPDTAARAILIKADISRDRKDYPLAQAEYQSLRDNNRYANTEAGLTARFRIVELMIEVRNYSGAETVMERMRISNDALVQAEAHYYAALIAFNQEMYDESWKELENCFKIKFDHSEGRLLEGQLKVVTRRRLDDTMVMVGREGKRERIAPGRQLALRIQDRERVAGGGSSSVPVLVRTSRGDEERVNLLQSSSDPSSFVAFVPTRLGNPVQGNLTIELYGNDEVAYEIDPEFRRTRNLPDYARQILVVADDARLSVSSGQILTEEEAEKRALQESLEGAASQSLRERALRANTVRPGSNIYVQVRDFDRSITDGKDTVTVDLQTSSGAQVTGFELREIEPYTGIFRGQVATAMPPPRVTASDSEDGRDPNVLISPQGGTWSSLSDGNKGKWIEVDTHSSHVFATAMLEMPDSAAVTNLRLEGMLAGDYQPIAAYPPRKGRDEGGCVVEVLHNGQEQRVDRIRTLISRMAQERKRMPGCQFDQEKTNWGKGHHRNFNARVAGYFYLSRYRRLELKFLYSNNEGQHQQRLIGHVYINGQPVFSGDITNTSVEDIFEVELPKGVHSFEMLLRQHHLREVQLTLGYRAEDGEFKPIPDEWFSTEANPELASFLEPGAKITRSDKGFEAAFTTANRYRRLRWVFDDFTGNSVSATRITVTNQERQTILPIAKETAAATTTTQVLGVSPGDIIDVVYRDEVTIEGDSQERTARLNASFYDGNIMVAHEIVTQGTDGRHITQYVPSMRCQPGDQLSILVTDFDEDLTANADTVTVNVTTSAGERISLPAVEIPEPHAIGNEVHTGRFMAVLRTSDTTDERLGMIRVQEGDQIVVSYLDRENLNPGIPYERSYSIQASGPAETRILVHPVTVRMVDDTSDEARNRLTMMRRRGMNTEGVRVLRPQFTAWDLDQRTTDARLQESIPVMHDGSDIRTSAGAPLVFEVFAPSAALHQSSMFEAVVVSGSELEAARQEGREPVLTPVPLRLSGVVGVVNEARSKGYDVQFVSGRSRDERQLLQRGVFAGIVRLQIGSPGDPINDLITNIPILDNQNLENRVPTIVVSGSDVVYLRAKNLKTGDMIESRVRLASEAQVSLLDYTGTAELSTVHLGERLMVRLTDYDQDTTPERDTVTLTSRSTKTGASINLTLNETLPRSGIFTVLFNPVFVREAAEVDRTGRLPVDYGDEITFTYKDEFTLQLDSTRDVTAVARIHHGADGELAVFSKRYVDPEMAVKVRFLWAEALFEMAKGLRAQNDRDGAMARTADGERILTEALRDYPNTSLKTQGEYLLANLAEEMAEDETDKGRKTVLYERAIVRYSNIVATSPNSDYAPRSQFKKALCLERMGMVDVACEEYVKLTYTWPDHELVADATTRLGQYYYRAGNYGVAARIFQSFARNRPTHPLASRGLFLAAQCRIKQAAEYAEGATPAVRARAREEYEEAVQILSNVMDTYKDDSALRAEAMYWVGDCNFKLSKFRESYIAFKTLTFEYPETDWAKRARGYLTDASLAKIEE